MNALAEGMVTPAPIKVTAGFKKSGREVETTLMPDMPLVLEGDFLEQVMDAANKWRGNVLLEAETFIARTFGVPSFIIRADCTVDDRGILRVYEFEEPPAGAGTLKNAFPQFGRLLGMAENNWPNFRAFVSPRKAHSDVRGWLGEADESYLAGAGLLWCVIRPEEADTYQHLIPRSVTPVRLEGNKAPLSVTFPDNRIGTGQRLLEGLDLSKRWAFKPLQGTRAHKVIIWWADRGDGLSRPKDTVVNEDKLRLLLTGDPEKFWLMQPFYPPRMVQDDFPQAPEDLRRCHWYIRRLYLAYVPKLGQYVPIGGAANMLNRRKYAIVHGRERAAFAPIMLPKTWEALVMARLQA